MLRFVLFMTVLFIATHANALDHPLSGYSAQGCGAGSCHYFSDASGSQTVSITEADGSEVAAVLAGSSNNYRYRISGVSFAFFGYSMGGLDVSVVDSSSVNAGALQIVNAAETTLMNQEVVHASSKSVNSGAVEWLFDWVAPATAGSYTIRACGLTKDVTMFFFATYRSTPCITQQVEVRSPPVANAGPDQNVVENSGTVTLTSAASTDADGTISSRVWLQLSGTAVTLSSATATSPTFSSPDVTADSTLVFRVTVTDNHGLTAQDTVSVVVANNPPPVANAGVDQQVDENFGSVDLIGSGSTDLVGGIATYSWVQTGGTSVAGGITNSTSANASFTAPINVSAAGETLVFQLTVTDLHGLTSTDSVNVVIMDITVPNLPPLVDAGVNQTVVENSGVVTLTGTASDSGGSISSVSWQQVSGTPSVTLTGSTTNPATFSAPDVSENTVLTFRFTATDDLGLAVQDDMTVTITNVVNLPPAVDAGSDIINTEGTTVNLSASVSDSDGSIASYLWEQVSGVDTNGNPVQVTFSATDIPNPTITLPSLTANATIELMLTVTDNQGAQTVDTLVISVTNANIAPQAIISGLDGNAVTSVLAGSRVYLSAQQSTDADGSSFTYLWEQISGTPVTDTSGTTASTFSFLAPEVSADETLQFRLTITDADGETDTATIDVLVSGEITVDAEQGELNYGVQPLDPDNTEVEIVCVSAVSSDCILPDADYLPEYDMAYGSTMVIRLSSDDLTSTNASAVVITLHMDHDAAANEGYFQFTSNGWVNAGDGLDFNNMVYTENGLAMPIDSAEFTDSDDIRIIVTDGGSLDADGEVNGTIVFISGVGKVTQNGTSGALAWQWLLLVVVLLGWGRNQARWRLL